MGSLLASLQTNPGQRPGDWFSSSAKSQQQPQQQQTSGPFGSTTTTQPQSSGLFGSGGNSNSQTSSLFGAKPATTAGGLFGSSQPQQQASPFGNNTTATQPSAAALFAASNTQSQQAQPKASLFGSTPQNEAQLPTTNPTSSLFGGTSNTSNTQPQPNPLFSGFGGSTAPSQTQQNPPVFGTAQPQQSSVFGSSQLLPSLTLGQSQSNSQQQQTVPGVKIDVSNLRGTTRFNDLHEELQKQVEQIDTFIQQQIGLKEQCDAIMPSHKENVDTLPRDVDFISNKVDTAELSISNEAAAIDTVRSTVKKDIAGARIGFRAIENLKLPQQFHYSGVWSGYHGGNAMAAQTQRRPDIDGTDEEASVDLVAFFGEQAEQMNKTLSHYAQNISEIETHLRNVEANTFTQSQQLMFSRGKDGAGRNTEEQIRELQTVLGEFRGGIEGIELKVDALRQDTQDLFLRRPPAK